MHDILFSYDFPPMGGGISRMMAEIATGYPAGGLVVSTGTIAGQQLVDASLSVRVDRVPVAVERLRTLQGRMVWSRRAIRLARQPTARFAWCGTLRPAAYPARAAWDRCGLPYGVIFYGGDLFALERKLARGPLTRRRYIRLLDAAAVLVAISRWTADRLGRVLEQLGLGRAVERIRVVGLGTDPTRFVPDPAAGEQFRRQRGLPAGRWLVTVARLVPHKGIDTAIDVVAELCRTVPELQYAVVGRGEYLAELRHRAAARGVAERVHFLTDVTDAELPGAFALGEVYLGLSREQGLDAEGFGISLLEAAACGLPVVAGASGGVADAVADGETGHLVAPDRSADASGAVHRLLTDRELADRMGRAGRRRVSAGYTWQHVVAELRSLAAEHGRR